MLRYRYTADESRRLDTRRQQPGLFNTTPELADAEFKPKYRRQSFFMSDTCDDSYTVRFNKSFPESSVIYIAGVATGLVSGNEFLPNLAGTRGRMEAISAPYQREQAHEEMPDLLFFWQELD